MNEAVKKLLFALGGFIVGSVVFWIAGIVATERVRIDAQAIIDAGTERIASLEDATTNFLGQFELGQGIIADLGAELDAANRELENLRKQVPRISAKLTDASSGISNAGTRADSLQDLLRRMDEELQKLAGETGSSEQ